ncbi:MAG: hypothetical protein ACKVX9_15435 [Blastocatellia bacterium]
MQDNGTDGNNETNETKPGRLRLFRYFRLFRALFFRQLNAIGLKAEFQTFLKELNIDEPAGTIA